MSAKSVKAGLIHGMMKRGGGTLIKIGRNDPCYCGSGKKYKKCCMEKDEQLQNQVEQKLEAKPKQLLNYEAVNQLSTDEIMMQLRELGIPFSTEQFLSDIETYYSAEELSEYWFN